MSAAATVRPSSLRHASTRRFAVPATALLGAAAAFVVVPHVLLLAFLGFAPLWLAAGAIAGAALVAAIAGDPLLARTAPVPLARILACVGVALLLHALGGRGQLFYANVDWQVRDAVLNDMILHRWPFAYRTAGETWLLRAPLAMYLAPALVGKLAGWQAAGGALLVQNALFTGLLLALAGTLFDNMRARAIALVAFVAFSGLDIVGALLRFDGKPLPDHIEWWSGTQFSSHLTQIFWVPQHAVAGWIGALAYLLWRDGRASPGTVAAMVPLAALWSPLGAMGILPFAAHAGLAALRARGLRARDVLLPLAATGFALASLAYLAAAGETVGARLVPLRPLNYATFELLEVAPYALPLVLLGARGRCGGVTLLLVVATLMAVPLIQIGQSADFTMRASNPALALLCAGAIDALVRPAPGRDAAAMRVALVAALAIGSVTGLRELRRALVVPPASPPLCSFFAAWEHHFGQYGKTTYVAPLARMPAAIRPAHATIVAVRDPARCWARPWPAASSY